MRAFDPESVCGGACSLLWGLLKQAMKSCFDGRVGDFGHPAIDQWQLIEQNEVELAAHGVDMLLIRATNPRSPTVDPYVAASTLHQAEQR